MAAFAFEQKAGVSIETVPLPGNFMLKPSKLPVAISHPMISPYFRRALAEIGRDDLTVHDLRRAHGSCSYRMELTCI